MPGVGLGLSPVFPGGGVSGGGAAPLLDGMVEYFSLDLAGSGLVGLHAGIELTNTGCTAGTGLVYPSACDITDTGDYYLSSDHVTLKNISNNADFEIAVWIYYRTLYATKPPYRAVMSNSSFRRGFELKGADNSQTALVIGKLETNYFLITHASPTPASAWKLCHFQFDATNGRLGASVNGGALSYTAGETGTSQAATNEMKIGWNAASDHMDGLIGPIAIFSRMLSADERTWLYNSGAGRTYAAIATWNGS